MCVVVCVAVRVAVSLRGKSDINDFRAVDTVCCSMLQCVLQCVAVCVAVCRSVCFNELQCVLPCVLSCVLQCVLQ